MEKRATVKLSGEKIIGLILILLLLVGIYLVLRKTLGGILG